MNPDILIRAHMIVDGLKAHGYTLATAESCTGGLIAAAITSVVGSSAAFHYGWVTYSAEAKEKQLGVPSALMANCGLVSEPVAAAMAEGALSQAESEFALAVTGNLGPEANDDKAEVGTICLALARKGQLVYTETICRPKIGRDQLREIVVLRALDILLSQKLA